MEKLITKRERNTIFAFFASGVILFFSMFFSPFDYAISAAHITKAPNTERYRSIKVELGFQVIANPNWDQFAHTYRSRSHSAQRNVGYKISARAVARKQMTLSRFSPVD